MPSTWRDQFRGSGDGKAWARGGGRGGARAAGLEAFCFVLQSFAAHVHSHTSPTRATMTATRTTMNHLSARPRTRAAVSSKSSSLREVGAKVDVGAGVGGTDGAPVGTGDTDGGGEIVGATEHACGTPGAAPSQHTVQVGSAATPRSSTQTGSRQPSSPKDQW